MKWTIAFDSGCDLRELSCSDDIALRLVPLKIVLGDRDITDDGQTSLAQLQEQLDTVKCKTGTACPSVGEWKAAMAEGEKVIAVTISGTVSGSYQSACAARDLLLEKDPSREIFVLDSIPPPPDTLFSTKISRLGSFSSSISRAAQALW